MPKKCKNPLMKVTATIMYYMEPQELTNKEVYEKLGVSSPTWLEKRKCPDKFTLGDLSILAKIFGVDITVLVGGLIPKDERSV